MAALFPATMHAQHFVEISPAFFCSDTRHRLLLEERDETMNPKDQSLKNAIVANASTMSAWSHSQTIFVNLFPPVVNTCINTG